MSTELLRIQTEPKPEYNRTENNSIGIDADDRVVPELTNVNTIWVANDGADEAWDIGDIGPGGGRIFYKDEDGGVTTYKEAAPVGTEVSRPWGGVGIETGATSDSDGASNTEDILEEFADHVYEDWFLPSKDELEEMYTELYKEGVGGFTDGYYWCSLETSATEAFTYIFISYSLSGYSKAKTLTYKVRPIRSFEGTVGDYALRDTGPAGGLIFAIVTGVGDARTFYEAAPVAYEYTAAWGAYGTTTGATGSAIGTGVTNTATIVAALETLEETGKAAQLCDDLSVDIIGVNAALYCDELETGGYSDWYLPSKDELDMIYDNLFNIVSPLGGFSAERYYSSTEVDADECYLQQFSDGTQKNRTKLNSKKFRAVRTFTTTVFPDGTKENPYKTIPKAISEVVAQTYISSTSDEYTVIQTAVIELDDLTLIADTGKILHVYRSGASADITISGGIINGCTVHAATGEAKTIEDCEVQFCSVLGDGIVDAIVTDSIMTAQLTGTAARTVITLASIAVNEPAILSLENCTIVNNGIGILTADEYDEGEVFVQNNIVSNNGIDIVAIAEINIENNMFNKYIGEIVSDTTIQGNPLLETDFSLKDLARGYAKDSPAIGAGNDGKDLGPFDVTRAISGYLILADLELEAAPTRIIENTFLGAYSKHEAYDGTFFDTSGKPGFYSRGYVLEWDPTASGETFSRQLDDLKYLSALTGEKFRYGKSINGEWSPHVSGTGAASGEEIEIAGNYGRNRWAGFYCKVGGVYYKITESTASIDNVCTLTLEGADFAEENKNYSIDFLLVTMDRMNGISHKRVTYIDGQLQTQETTYETGYKIILRQTK